MWAWAALVPWKLVGWGLAAALVVYVVYDYGRQEFRNGQSDVRRAWAQAESDRLSVASKAHLQDLADARERQARADATAMQHAEAITKARADLDRAVALGDRLRATIRSVTVANRARAATPSASGGDADDIASALGRLLESCSAVAERSAGQAEGLADQVRGLQSHIKAVTDQEGLK